MDQLKTLFEIIEKNVFSSPKSTTIILGSTVSLIVVSYWIKSYLNHRSYFKRINLKAPTPLPLFGNLLDLICYGLHPADTKLMNTYGKICGRFEGTTPVIMTTDIKFIKTFMIKDFNNFVNRRKFRVFQFDPMDKFMLAFEDDEWKSVRSLVSTTFSSSKLKSMSKCITDLLKNYETYLHDLTEKDGILVSKDFFSNYTLAVISSCCFGIDTGSSINDPNNEYLKSIKEIWDSSISYKFIFMFFFPDLANFFYHLNLIEVMPRKPFRFLEASINEIIRRRKEKLDVREDLIQYMIEREDNSSSGETKSESKDGSLKTWQLKKTLTNKEILAQALQFLLAGYDTTATCLEFVSYHLATRKDIQERLIEEVDRVLENHNNEINYDSISEMKYMDMVIDETLRMYPPGTRLERVANNDYEYEGIKIKKGQIITVPIYVLHHDPDLYPNPDEFDPERFNDENKKLRDGIAYLAFGAGPRNCIGMRFALIEVKFLLATILSKFRFSTCSQTPEKIVLISSGLCKSTKPIIVKVEKR